MMVIVRVSDKKLNHFKEFSSSLLIPQHIAPPPPCSAQYLPMFTSHSFLAGARAGAGSRGSDPSLPRSRQQSTPSTKLENKIPLLKVILLVQTHDYI